MRESFPSNHYEPEKPANENTPQNKGIGPIEELKQFISQAKERMKKGEYGAAGIHHSQAEWALHDLDGGESLTPKEARALREELSRIGSRIEGTDLSETEDSASTGS